MIPVDLNIPNDSFEEPALEAWRQLRSMADPFPFETDDRVQIDARFPCGLPPEALAIAEILPPGRILPETARICLSEQFFSKLSGIQIGVLLHETIHVRFYLGRLAANYRVNQALRHAPPPERESDQTRLRVAVELLNLVQEIADDRFMAKRYAWVAADYTTLRYKSLYTRPISDQKLPASLRPYATFIGLIQAELGLKLIREDERRRFLSDVRDQHLSALRQCDPALAESLETIGVSLLNVDITTDEPDPESYRELFDRVMAVTD